jgi:hypothetical protein
MLNNRKTKILSSLWRGLQKNANHLMMPPKVTKEALIKATQTVKN